MKVLEKDILDRSMDHICSSFHSDVLERPGSRKIHPIVIIIVIIVECREENVHTSISAWYILGN